MQRVGIRLKVRPDRLEEYRRLHDPVWPELAAALRDAGVTNYSLWLDDDGTEFGYLECENWDAVCASLTKSEVHTRWQRMMREFLEMPADTALGGQPVRLLERVFQLAE